MASTTIGEVIRESGADIKNTLDHLFIIQEKLNPKLLQETNLNALELTSLYGGLLDMRGEDAAKVKKHLEKVCEQGYALDEEEHGRGILCCAAPVFDHTGDIAGTIGITAAAVNWTMKSFKDKVVPAVVRASNKVSKLMGGT